MSRSRTERPRYVTQKVYEVHHYAMAVHTGARSKKTISRRIRGIRSLFKEDLLRCTDTCCSPEYCKICDVAVKATKESPYVMAHAANRFWLIKGAEGHF